MADFTASSEGAGAAIATGKYVNIAAAAVSVTLIAGVGVWGYKLLMRDVTGVPVVKAMVGEMRVAPENPGGEIASNIGLSVNSVPAEGGAAAPEDRLVLAPSGVALEAEDFDVTQTAEAGEVAPAAESDALAQPVPATLTNAEDVPVDRLGTPVAAPLTENDVLALADQIAAGAIPLSDLAEGETTPIEVAVNGVAVNSDIIPDAVPGVRRSLRPVVRSAVLRAPTPAAAPVAASAAVQTPAPAAAPASAAVTTAALPWAQNWCSWAHLTAPISRPLNGRA